MIKTKTTIPNIRTNPALFLGYEIGQAGSDRIMLRRQGVSYGYDCHLGYYSTVEQAKKAAVLYFMLARPETFAGAIASIISDRNRGADLPLDYYLFKGAVKDAGLEMPPELTDGEGKPAPCKRASLPVLGIESISTYGGIHLYFNGELFKGFIKEGE